MAGFIVFAGIVIIIIIIIKKKKEKNEEQKRELMNCFGYINFVKPLQLALKEEGYYISSINTSKRARGYLGSMYVSKHDEFLGHIYFVTYPADLMDYEYSVISSNIGADSAEIAAGYKKYMAIQNGRTGVIISSSIATKVDPPDIPEWLMIAAKVYQESGYEFTDPDWISKDRDYSDYKKWLNVMFR